MKKERKVIDAHLHIFGHCEFGDRLAHGIGDEPTQEYLTEKYYMVMIEIHCSRFVMA